jgi:hypothetical protein
MPSHVPQWNVSVSIPDERGSASTSLANAPHRGQVVYFERMRTQDGEGLSSCIIDPIPESVVIAHVGNPTY